MSFMKMCQFKYDVYPLKILSLASVYNNSTILSFLASLFLAFLKEMFILVSRSSPKSAYKLCLLATSYS